MRIVVLSTVALMIVGAVGTWATASVLGISASVNGGDRDGIIVIVCAAIIAAAAVVASRPLAIVALLAAFAATATAIYDVVDIQGTEQVSVGWGLWLALVASVVAVIDVVVLLAASRRSTAPA